MTHKPSYYITNGLTLYRLCAAPVLLLLVLTGQMELFGYLLPFSFLTDFIDGYLARKYKTTSVFGSRLDSLADDLTVVVGIIAMFVFRLDFLASVKWMMGVLLFLYLLQTGLALWRYHRITSFHTWLAKISALLQGLFLMGAFFFPQPSTIFFYIMAIVTCLDLIEETIMVVLLPNWVSDVKGIQQALKVRKGRAGD